MTIAGGMSVVFSWTWRINKDLRARFDIACKWARQTADKNPERKNDEDWDLVLAYTLSSHRPESHQLRRKVTTKRCR